jgi:hypothetical protein
MYVSIYISMYISLDTYILCVCYRESVESLRTGERIGASRTTAAWSVRGTHTPVPQAGKPFPQPFPWRVIQASALAFHTAIALDTIVHRQISQATYPSIIEVRTGAVHHE